MAPKAAPAAPPAKDDAASAASFTVGQRVMVQNRYGTVMFCGVAQFAAGVWVGIALDDPVGKNDGTVQGVSYFKCEPNRGIFVRPTNVQPAPAEAKAEAKGGGSKSGKAKDGTPKAAGASPKKEKTEKTAEKAAAAEGSPTAAAAKAAAKAPAVLDPSPASSPTAKSASKTGGSSSRGGEKVSSKSGGTSSKGTPKAATPAVEKAAPASPPAPAAAPTAKEKEAKTPTAKASSKKAAAASEPAAAAPAAAEPPKVEATPAPAPAPPPVPDVPDDPEVAETLKLIQNDIDKLESTLQEELEKLKNAKTQADRACAENDKIKQSLDDSSAAMVAREAQAAELRRQKESAESEERALMQENTELESEMAALRKKNEELELAMGGGAAAAAGDSAEAAAADADGAIEGPTPSKLQTIRNEIQLQQSEKELLELELEAANLKVEELRATLEETNTGPLSEEMQIAWHKKALWKFYEDHQAELRRLRRRQSTLERAQKMNKKQSALQNADVDQLRDSVNLLTEQIAHLTKENDMMANTLAEQTGLQNEDAEMLQAQEELEVAYREEIDAMRAREVQLESMASQLYQGQYQLQIRRQSEAGKVARLQIRLQNMQKQSASARGGDPMKVELEIGSAIARGRKETVRAEAWSACIPSSVINEASLGQSFDTLCALHRCLQKAQILSQSVYKCYVEDSVLSMLQENVPMGYLCNLSAASAQVAFAAVGVVGRLHSIPAERYTKLIQKPAMVSCAEGEHALDAALAQLFGMLAEATGDPANFTERKSQAELLSAINAQCAQLLSVQNSLFKDEPFASWQGAGFACEAVRAACSIALYAGDDAGGPQRPMWQALFGKSDRLARFLERHANQRSLTKDGLLAVEPGQPLPKPLEGSEMSQSEYLDMKDPMELAKEGHLVQGLLDGISRQASLLHACAENTKLDDPAAVSKLEKLFRHTDAQLDALTAILEARAAKPGKTVPKTEKPLVPPYVQPRDAVRQRVEVAEHDAPIAKAEAQKELNQVAEAIADAEKQVLELEKKVAQGEQEYSIARIEAEQCTLAESQLKTFNKQLKAGTRRNMMLKKELEKESEDVGKHEGIADQLRKECKALQAELTEWERRLEKRYNSHIPMEEVMALRRTCVRQQRDINGLKRRNADVGGALHVHGNPTNAWWMTDGMGNRRIRKAPTLKAQSTKDISAGIFKTISLESCWDSVQETEKELLLEQAKTSLVSLEEPEPEKAPEQQFERLGKIAKRTLALRSDITGLLRQVANTGKKEVSSQFSSVALTRFLKETTASVDRGAAAMVHMPLGTLAADSTPNTNTMKALLRPAMPVLADMDQLRSVHHSCL